jgi:hypothetical protein
MALTVPPAFATTEQVEARWRTLTEAEATRATQLLLDASQLILDEDMHGVLADLTAPTQTLVSVTCSMVIRAMASGVEAGPPATQTSWGAGPFNASTTFANPTGDLYLTKSERRRLGFSRQRAGAVDMWAGAYETTAPVEETI